MISSVAKTAPTQFLDIGGTRFAYRRFGNPAGTPLVFTQHFMGNLDNFDPAISDALAPGREIILFDNAGVGRSTGTASDIIAGLEEFRDVFLSRSSSSATRSCARASSATASASSAQRHHQRRKHLIGRRLLISRHTRTLPDEEPPPADTSLPSAGAGFQYPAGAGVGAQAPGEDDAALRSGLGARSRR